MHQSLPLFPDQDLAAQTIRDCNCLMQHLTDLLKFIAAGPRRLWLALWVVGAAILFLPEKIAEPLGFVVLRGTQRSLIGAPALLFFILWLASFWQDIVVRRERQKNRSEMLAALSELSDAEYLVLFYCDTQSQRTIFLPPHDPRTENLILKRIIDGGSRRRTVGPAKYVVTDRAWREIRGVLTLKGLADPSWQREMEESIVAFHKDQCHCWEMEKNFPW